MISWDFVLNILLKALFIATILYSNRTFWRFAWIFTVRRYTSKVYAMALCVCVCLSDHPSVRHKPVSVKTAKDIITQRCIVSLVTLVFGCQKSWGNSNGSPRMRT